MPLPFSHGLVGASVVAALHPSPLANRYRLPMLAGALLANSADLDFVLVWMFNSKEWHRGFTHSLGFSLLVGLIAYALLQAPRARESVAYALAYASHAALDYATALRGGGVELFWPASRERVRLGLFGLSEVPSQMTAAEIIVSVLFELLIFAPPLVALVLLRRRLAKVKSVPAA